MFQLDHDPLGDSTNLPHDRPLNQILEVGKEGEERQQGIQRGQQGIQREQQGIQ